VSTADRFTEFPQKLDVKPATLALARTMSHPDVTAAIIGARNLTQLEDSPAALDVDMTNDLREEISALSPAPAPASDRIETRNRTGPDRLCALPDTSNIEGSRNVMRGVALRPAPRIRAGGVSRTHWR
jgi:hypothetical protein